MEDSVAVTAGVSGDAWVLSILTGRFTAITLRINGLPLTFCSGAGLTGISKNPTRIIPHRFFRPTRAYARLLFGLNY
jgi:hypothetical protein